MFIIIKGVGLLFIVLALFSLFSLKAPKGSLAMSGLANAAVASYLIEAVHVHVFGNLLGIKFLGDVGSASGGLSGVAATVLVPISMGVNPVFAVVGGLALGPIANTSGYGILPGFIAGYAIGFIAPLIEKYLPEGIDLVIGALTIAPIARIIAMMISPLVDSSLGIIGDTIIAATETSPILMGFLLGGIIKMVCTAPISSMALTAMIGLTGLPMGIAAIACFGGSFTNATVFKLLNLGNRGNIIAVMLEPLTQAKIVMENPIPIFSSNMLGGGLAGIAAAVLGIVNDAPGTAAPIPGMLAPFGFNPAGKVLLALLLAAIGGISAGVLGGLFWRKRFGKPKIVVDHSTSEE
jgi:fructose-specific phosphotransferase system IIC component